MASTSSNETDALLGAQNPDGGNGSKQVEVGEAVESSPRFAPNRSGVPTWLQAFFSILLACVLIVAVTFSTTLVIDRHRSSTSAESSSDALADHEASKESPRKSKYKATQFISFTINTLGGSSADGECDGRNVDPKTGLCYLGNTRDLAEDVHHRVRIVEKVLHKLTNDAFTEEPEIDRNSNVLKIVMLPEFFWRGPFGVYSMKDLYDDTEDDSKDGILIQVADRLRAIISDDAFADYLFVAGTILAAQPTDPQMNLTQALENARNIMYYNFATMIKGGKGHSHYYFVQKRYISGADFLSRAQLPNPSDEDMHLYGDATLPLQETLRKRGDTIVSHNVVEIDGIRFGIEICLDHRMGQLYNNIQLYENGQLVDVHLITSAGMAIERGPNPIVPGGVVYLSDGEASSAACLRTEQGIFDPDHVCRGHPDGIKHIPVGGPGYSNFFPMSACWDMKDRELLTGYYSVHQTQGCAYTLKLYGLDMQERFKHNLPSIEIYPTVELPELENE